VYKSCIVCWVYRWKIGEDGKVVKVNEIPIIQFVAIRRKDSGDIAIPGGIE
jgi:hypothetical protein